jgi:hypothetical protein
VQSVLDDYRTAPISEPERALFAFIAKMVEDSTTIGQADVDALCAAGWSEEAIYDAISVCALFQFYNNWIDAAGVRDMPAFAYEASGKRLATMGYTSDASPAPVERAATRTDSRA